MNSMSVLIFPHHYQTNICPEKSTKAYAGMQEQSRDDRQVKCRPLIAWWTIEFDCSCAVPAWTNDLPISSIMSNLAPFNSLRYAQYAPLRTVFASKSNLPISLLLAASNINFKSQDSLLATGRELPVTIQSLDSTFVWSSRGQSRIRRNGMEPKLRHMDYKVLIARSTCLLCAVTRSSGWQLEPFDPDPTLNSVCKMLT